MTAYSEEDRGAGVSAEAVAEAKVMAAEVAEAVTEAAIANNKNRISRKDRMRINSKLKTTQLAVKASQLFRELCLLMKGSNSRSAEKARNVPERNAGSSIIHLMASHQQLSLAIFLLLILNQDPFLPTHNLNINPTNNLALNIPPNIIRSLTRNIIRSLTRNIIRSLTRNITRNLTHNIPRNLTRVHIRNMYRHNTLIPTHSISHLGRTTLLIRNITLSPSPVTITHTLLNLNQRPYTCHLSHNRCNHIPSQLSRQQSGSSRAISTLRKR